VSKLDLISGRIRQGGENPADIKRREEADKKKRKAKEKRPFWKSDWRK